MIKVKPQNIDGTPIDENKLTDGQALLVEKISNVDLDEISKHKGSYVVWGCLPETQKIAIKAKFENEFGVLAFARAMADLMEFESDGKLTLVVVEKE